MKARYKKILFSGVALSALFLAALLNQGGISDHPALDTSPDVAPAGQQETPGGWLAEIRRSTPDEAVRLARARGDRMRALIRSNPEQAVAEALTLAEWSRLPPEIRAAVEQPFSAVADVEVLIACGGQESRTYVQLELPGIGTLETHVFGRRGETDSKVGIPVQGIRVGKVAALREEIFQPLERDDESSALLLYPVAVEKQGAESVAALAGGKVFYFNDRAALNEANAQLAKMEELPGPDSGTQALFQELEAYILPGGAIDFQALEADTVAAAAAWSGTPRDMYVIMCDFPDDTGQPADPVAFSNALNSSVSQQIWEMSYEKTHIVGTVNPVTYRLPSASHTYTNNTAQLHSDAEALAVADGVNLSPYDTVCVLFPNVTGLWWSGLASVGGKNMWLNGSVNNDVVTHELGHNYGARHASAWTNSVSSSPILPPPVGGKVEYGDFSDIMGSGDSPAGHFNCWHKKHIGWFDAANWRTVSTSGTYRVYRSDHRQTTGLVRGLEISKGGGDTYWVGLRQEYPLYDSFSRGAYLLWKKGGDNRSYLLDMSPLSAGGKQDGGLALGQTYSDAAAGVHITPTARGGQTPNEWMDITVNLGSFPGNSAPSASISGPSSLGVNESTLFSVTASDADGDELAYFWDTGDGLVKPNGPVIPVAFLSGGTATVSCTVSDMRGGTNRVSKSVVLSSPLDNWTQRTSGTTVQLNDIVEGNGRLVVVGRDWKTLYSDDGISWTVVTQNNVYLGGVVYDGSKFVTAGYDYNFGTSAWEGAVLTSADGTSWTRVYIGGPHLKDIVYNGGVYVAVGDGGTILRSTDGISWSTVSSGTGIDLQSVSYGAGTFVAVGDASTGGSNPHVVLTSANGSSWTDRTSGTTLPLGNWLFDVQYCNDRFLAGGWGSEILSSTNLGVSFESTVSGSLNMEAFAYGNGTYFAAGRDIAAGNADLNMVSADGVNWSRLSTPSQADRNGVVFFNGTFITVGDNGAIWQSGSVTAAGGGFAAWQIQHQSALGFNRDPLEDADFDGYNNLAEYALGSVATDAGSAPVYSGTAGSYLTLAYDRNGVQSDVNYTVERNINLVSNAWNSAGTVVLEDSATNLTVRSAYPIASQTNEFMRLYLELN